MWPLLALSLRLEIGKLAALFIPVGFLANSFEYMKEAALKRI